MNDDGCYAGPRMCKEFDEYQKARHFHLWHVVGGEAENMCSVRVFRLLTHSWAIGLTGQRAPSCYNQPLETLGQHQVVKVERVGAHWRHVDDS
jgi:hypothetical protein